MDWDKLRIFHAAAAAGSFTHAGEALHMSQSAVSRQVSALEKDLRVSLFHRHARGLVLTEQGEMLYQTVADVMSKLQTAETLLADTTTKPSGDLRIASPVGLGTVWVSQRLREFMDLYPDIRVDLVLNDDQIDIAMRAADVAIWTREPEQSDLIRRPLFHGQGAPDSRRRSTRAASERPTRCPTSTKVTASSPTAASLRSSCPRSAGSRRQGATAATRASRHFASTASSPSSTRSSPASASA